MEPVPDPAPQPSVQRRIFKSLAQIVEIKVYTLQAMCVATENFRSLLGAGSNGEVFEGYLDGRAIAVKRLPQEAWCIPEVREVFEREIRNIGAVNHRNIVRLLGFCLEGDSPLLVCPLLCSLERALGQNEDQLSWDARYSMAIGVARGLAYLHGGARTPMIHCDIKPGNVLYDPDTFEAYIADFGLAIHIPQQAELENESNVFPGTIGFMAPEVRLHQLSVKADVYSYGKLLYALVSGKNNVNKLPDRLVLRKRSDLGRLCLRCRDRISLVFSSARLFLLHTNLRDLDPSQQFTVARSGRAVLQASKALDVISLCTQDDPQCRPDMERVVAALESANVCPVPLVLTASVLLGSCIPRASVKLGSWVPRVLVFLFLLMSLLLFLTGPFWFSMMVVYALNSKAACYNGYRGCVIYVIYAALLGVITIFWLQIAVVLMGSAVGTDYWASMRV